MKLRKHAYRAYFEVHTWTGLIGGFVLLSIFFTGVFALFHDELFVWSDAALVADDTKAHDAAAAFSTVDTVVAEEIAKGSGDAYVALPEGSRGTVFVSAPDPAGGPRVMSSADVATGARIPERSLVSRMLLYTHFTYYPPAPWTFYLVGLFGLIFLFGVVSGVLIHLKDIVWQFHRFRPRAAARDLWTDLHKVTGVVGLPFQVVIAFTGVLISLLALLVAPFIGPVFASQEEATALFYGAHPEPEETEKRATPVSAATLVANAQAALPGFEPHSFGYRKLGNAGGTVDIHGEMTGDEGPGRRFSPEAEVILRARDGEVLGVSRPDATPAATIRRFVIGLHFAHFGGLPLRIAYALLGLLGALTLVSGNLMWVARRKRLAQERGVPGRPHLFGRLTVGVAGGLAVGTSLLFLTNRLVPIGEPSRTDLEVVAFFGGWALVALGSCAVRSLARCGAATLGASAAMLVLIPLVSAARGLPGLFDFAGVGAAVELGLCVLAGLYAAGAFAALRATRGTAPAPPVTEPAALEGRHA